MIMGFGFMTGSAVATDVGLSFLGLGLELGSKKIGCKYR